MDFFAARLVDLVRLFFHKLDVLFLKHQVDVLLDEVFDGPTDLARYFLLLFILSLIFVCFLFHRK